MELKLLPLHVFIGKIWVPKQKAIDPVLESVTLEPELEEALANASDAELCDIAGKMQLLNVLALLLLQLSLFQKALSSLH